MEHPCIVSIDRKNVSARELMNRSQGMMYVTLLQLFRRGFLANLYWRPIEQNHIPELHRFRRSMIRASSEFEYGLHLDTYTQSLVSRCRFFYKPITLTALTFGLCLLAYIATTQDVMEEGRDKRRV
jgi:hypothetical protein